MYNAFFNFKNASRPVLLVEYDDSILQQFAPGGDNLPETFRLFESLTEKTLQGLYPLFEIVVIYNPFQKTVVYVPDGHPVLKVDAIFSMVEEVKQAVILTGPFMWRNILP